VFTIFDNICVQCKKKKVCRSVTYILKTYLKSQQSLFQLLYVTVIQYEYSEISRTEWDGTKLRVSGNVAMSSPVSQSVRYSSKPSHCCASPRRNFRTTEIRDGRKRHLAVLVGVERVKKQEQGVLASASLCSSHASTYHFDMYACFSRKFSLTFFHICRLMEGE
jgi:hypothetical protein